MQKLLVGLVKGLVLGAAVGYGAFAMDQHGGFAPVDWLTYGIIAALVGLFVGRPIWRNILDKESTAWVSVIKSIVGFGVGVGLYFLVDKAWGGFRLSIAALDANNTSFQDIPVIFGGIVGAVYGAFVELDDSLDDDKSKAKKLPESTAAKKAAK